MSPRKPRPLLAVPDRVTPTADLETLAERAASLHDGILNCREHRRHDWRPASARRHGGGFSRTERCSDCHSERHQDLDSRGLVVSTSVTYSEGYLNPRGTGRVDQTGQGVYRLERMLRLVGEHPAVPEEKDKPKRRSTRKAASA